MGLNRDLQQIFVHRWGGGASIETAGDPIDGALVLQVCQVPACETTLLGLRSGERDGKTVDQRFSYWAHLLRLYIILPRS